MNLSTFKVMAPPARFSFLRGQHMLVEKLKLPRKHKNQSPLHHHISHSLPSSLQAVCRPLGVHVIHLVEDGPSVAGVRERAGFPHFSWGWSHSVYPLICGRAGYTDTLLPSVPAQADRRAPSESLSRCMCLLVAANQTPSPAPSLGTLFLALFQLHPSTGAPSQALLLLGVFPALQAVRAQDVLPRKRLCPSRTWPQLCSSISGSEDLPEKLAAGAS